MSETPEVFCAWCEMPIVKGQNVVVLARLKAGEKADPRRLETFHRSCYKRSLRAHLNPLEMKGVSENDV